MEKVSNINFKAQPINTIKIKTFSKNDKKYIPLKTTFVKLERKNNYDTIAVNKAAKKWKHAKYMKKIATNFNFANYIPLELYAITTQMKNFDKLNYKNILGFAEMRPDNYLKGFTSLYYIQSKTGAVNNTETSDKKYKEVGSSILTSLKKIYKNISLFSEDSPMLFMFYKKTIL